MDTIPWIAAPTPPSLASKKYIYIYVHLSRVASCRNSSQPVSGVIVMEGDVRGDLELPPFHPAPCKLVQHSAGSPPRKHTRSSWDPEFSEGPGNQRSFRHTRLAARSRSRARCRFLGTYVFSAGQTSTHTPNADTIDTSLTSTPSFAAGQSGIAGDWISWRPPVLTNPKQ